MPDAREILERQRRWQHGRTALTWAEKVRMAERIRESARALRASAVKRQDDLRHEPPKV